MIGNEEPHSLGNLSAEHLKAFVERIERVQKRIGNLNDDKRDIYTEAKGNGFDVKAIKHIVAMRAKDQNSVREFETIVDLYKNALGMD